MSTAALMARQQRLHMLRETLVSMMINASLSALFVFLIFGGRDRVALWGTGGLALDFVPQTFIIAFMATLVPSLITRRRIRLGKMAGAASGASKLPGNLVMRSLMIAALVSIVAIPLAVAAIAFCSSGELNFATVLPMKILYGATLALLVTTFSIRAAFGDGAGA